MKLRALSALLACSALAPSIVHAAPPASTVTPSPRTEPLYQMAIPATVTLIAWLPVAGQPDWIDVDVRIEVVVPFKCGDRLGGVTRAGGPKLDGPDAWDVIIQHKPSPECTAEPTRMGNRYTVRMKVPEGQTRDLSIGATIVKISRGGGKVRLNGVLPEGDVAGAPPTAKPISMTAGEVVSAKVVSAERDSGDIDSARAVLLVTAKYPGCAEPPVGMLARGDASTRFALSRYAPLAPVNLDKPCKDKPAARTHEISTLVRLPKKGNEAKFTVGNIPLTVKVGPRPAAAPPPKQIPMAPMVPTDRDTTHGPIPNPPGGH